MKKPSKKDTATKGKIALTKKTIVKKATVFKKGAVVKKIALVKKVATANKDNIAKKAAVMEEAVEVEKKAAVKKPALRHKAKETVRRFSHAHINDGDLKEDSYAALDGDSGSQSEEAGLYKVLYEDGSEMATEEHELDCGCDMDDEESVHRLVAL
jgi:hypothetical protein